MRVERSCCPFLKNILYTKGNPVNENNLHKRIFTEQESPVPLVPPDTAWDHMHTKLEQEMPQKKKRRVLGWITPIGCAGWLLGGLLAGGTIWWYNRSSASEKIVQQQQPAMPATRSVTSNSIHENESTGNHSTQATKQQKAPPFLQHKANKPQERATAIPGEILQAEVVNLDPTTVSAITSDQNINIIPYKTLPGWQQTAIASPAKKTKDTNRLAYAAGLQWNLPVPVTSANAYFKGANGTSEPHRLLLPGLWGSIIKGRHQLVGEVSPFFSALQPGRSYNMDKVLLPDGTTVEMDGPIKKTFGVQAALRYNYRVAAHWGAEVGLEANWWKRSLGYAIAKVDSSSNVRAPYFYEITTPLHRYMVTAIQLSPSVGLVYQYKNIQGILRVSTPLNATVRNMPKPVWLNLGIRWSILHTKPHAQSSAISSSQHKKYQKE